MLFVVPAAIAGMLLVGLIGGELVKLLWNWLLPPLFGWRELTVWQALGMLALCRILFGGSGMMSGRRLAFRRRMDGRWEKMSPEERERLRQRMVDRCGFGPSTGEAKAP
jgi:hypothetical protein